MLTVITGLPGSGKTSHVVEKFLMPLAAKDWEENAITADGEPVKVKRKLYTNIKGLILEHELISDAELLTWPKWVKPGDLIVFDEVQKPWPLTGANMKQPECITELETHRHYGIDMILLTQHPMLVNAALPRLAGQHLHVRKLGASRYATVYEWDGVSRTLLYKNAFAKRPWRRSKTVESVYRSSSLHTKQKRAVPTVVFGVFFAIALMAYFGPVVYARMTEIASGERGTLSKAQPPARPASAPASAVRAPGGPQAVAIATTVPDTVPSPPVQAASGPILIGCARMADRCTCFNPQGERADKPVQYCEDKTGANLPAKRAEVVLPGYAVEPRPMRESDRQLVHDAERLLESRRRGISTAALQSSE